MTISELIEVLNRIKDKHGDIKVKYQTLSHVWTPEPEIRKTGDTEYVLLNP